MYQKICFKQTLETLVALYFVLYNVEIHHEFELKNFVIKEKKIKASTKFSNSHELHIVHLSGPNYLSVSLFSFLSLDLEKFSSFFFLSLTFDQLVSAILLLIFPLRLFLSVPDLHALNTEY